MRPKSIGIIGGAGPMAGVLLLEKLFSLATAQYGCFRDSDYPQVMLISFPFSEMLTEQKETLAVQYELQGCINQLKQNGASILAIACNTLHAFLNNEIAELIHLPKATAAQIPPGEIPLVLCTSTSRQSNLHNRFFPCDYPPPQCQAKIDRLIDQILKGEKPLAELKRLIANQSLNVIVLGCTELSLYATELTCTTKTIIDPLEIMAKQLLSKSFEEGI